MTNAEQNFAQDQQRQIDLLVDGELDESERRATSLASFDAQP